MLLAGGASQPSLTLYSLKVQSTVPVLSSVPHVKLPEVYVKGRDHVDMISSVSCCLWRDICDALTDQH